MYFATDSLRWTPFANHVSFRTSMSHFSFSPVVMLLRSFRYHTTCIHLSKTAPISRWVIYKGLLGSWVGRIPNLRTTVLITILPPAKRESSPLLDGDSVSGKLVVGRKSSYIDVSIRISTERQQTYQDGQTSWACQQQLLSFEPSVFFFFRIISNNQDLLWGCKFYKTRRQYRYYGN